LAVSFPRPHIDPARRGAWSAEIEHYGHQPNLLHRLDRGTSGLMVYAKSLENAQQNRPPANVASEIVIAIFPTTSIFGPVRPLARDLWVLIGWPFPLGFGLGGRLLLARRGRAYI